MALPGSPNQLTFEQIGTELGISTAGPHSLRQMSDLADFTTPDEIEDFWDYEHESIPDPPFKVGANMNFVPRATWFDGSDNETGFRIQWSVNGGGYGNTHTSGANTTTAPFPATCQNGSTYKPRVQSFNDAGNSSYITGGQTTGDGDCPF
jgi:hypothetical protein